MKTSSRAILIGLIVVLILAVPLGRAVLFTVNEREVAVVLQFGQPKKSCTTPGLYFKLPFVQEVRRLPKTYQFWSGAEGQVLVDLPTADGKKVEVTPWAVWRITDPARFVRVLRTVDGAETRVTDFVRSATRDVITRNKLTDVIRSTNRKLTYTFQVEPSQGDRSPEASQQQGAPEAKPAAGPSSGAKATEFVGRREIVREIKRIAQTRLAEGEQNEQGGRGIELVDVGISKIDFVDKVREAAFERLIAFMDSISSRHLNEGERRKQEILNQTEREVEKILGEGSQQASSIRGQADAKIIDAYATAIKETGEFYNFVRTLEAYKASMGSNTRLILTTDSDLLRLLKEGPPAPTGTPPKGQN